MVIHCLRISDNGYSLFDPFLYILNCMKLHRPIGIFDAGIGSYAVVERVRSHFPMQDILYFADRASFPYGEKAPNELLGSVKSATEYLSNEGCVAVVLASNAPSVTVLDALRATVAVPVIGIFPPVREAVELSRSKQVAVLGVRSMITSEAMKIYARRNSTAESEVLLINASALVDLVENFKFLTAPSETQKAVSQFIANVLQEHAKVDVITLSSTHLPWLREFFQTAAPNVLFLDPADTVLEQLSPYSSIGQGLAHFVATETPTLGLDQFNGALRALGVTQKAELKT